jgi:hypothetical protein
LLKISPLTDLQASKQTQMESSNSIDLQVLQLTESANSTTTRAQPSQPVSSALPARVGSAQAERQPTATRTGISTPTSNAGPSLSNERVENGISPSPETGSGNLEDYLQKRAYSDRQSRKLFYSYKDFKDRPATGLFGNLLYLDYLDWVNVIAECHIRAKTTFAELLAALETVLLQPSSGSLRLWYALYLLAPTSKFEYQ